VTGSEAEAKMRATDSLLWRIERDPVLRSTVTAVSLLDRAPNWDQLRRRMISASYRIPHLRQVVVDPPLGVGSPSWAEATELDIDYHLRRVRLPRPATLASVLDFAAHEAMREFDRARPLWEFTVIEGVGDGAAFIQKFHHSVTDGIGGMRLALEILDTERHPRVNAASITPLRREEHQESVPASRPVGRQIESLLGYAGAFGRRAVNFPAAFTSAALRSGRTPVRSALGAAENLRWSARLVAPVSEPLSPVMRSRSTNLVFRAFDVDLERLRDAGHRADGSLNDAFVAAVAAGLRRYHDANGAPVTSLRMTLPINIRSENDTAAGNRFTPVRFVVPLEPSDPATMVAAVSRLVHEWRDGPALGLTDALASIINALPTQVVTSIFASMLRNVDFVATNIPGIPIPVYLAGAKVNRQYAFAPPSGASVNVALVSHVGHCCIGVNIDPKAVPSPELLVSCLEEGFEEVLSLAPRSGKDASGVEQAGGGL
jgi:diacylglycerol O-acyltransferase